MAGDRHRVVVIGCGFGGLNVVRGLADADVDVTMVDRTNQHLFHFGNDRLADFAPGMKTVEDARCLRDAILAKFETAEVATDPQERADRLTFVVIGAGPTGVELVGQIAELAHTVLPRDHRKADPATGPQAYKPPRWHGILPPQTNAPTVRSIAG
jgi:NADH dehydrogenase FAD-containing subunit